ncbi:MAG TPA: hypothetical protein VN684_03945 [Terriglobales bacterium]|nr:hypothetical protein [Terriglobales bacterium]
MQPSLQALTNKRISEFVPRHAWQSIVAIVIVKKPSVYLLGTGSLFQIADHHFVVTAAHVVKRAYQHDKTIGIAGDSNSLISVHGDWILSTSASENDPFDTAVYLLPDNAVQRLSQFRFFRLSDVNFGEQSKTTIFTVFGHPEIWSMPSHDEKEKVQIKGLEYTACTYVKSTEALIGYDRKYHLLLDADAKQVTWTDGSVAEFRRQNGTNATFPHDLKGMSGGPVWTIGDLDIETRNWPRIAPNWVGVQTGVYQPSQVIRVTRWVAVSTLIHSAFPELRSALEILF